MTSEAHEEHMELLSPRVVMYRKCKRLDAIPLVINVISSFLDNSASWRLESASEAGLILLLDRLLTQEWHGLSMEFRQARCLHAIKCAATNDQGAVLKWWLENYLLSEIPNGASQAILRFAVFHGHLNMLTGEFFRAEESLQMINALDHPLVCQHPAIVRWIRKESDHALVVLLDVAMKKGDLEFIKWLHNTLGTADSVMTSDKGSYNAVQTGQIEILRYLHDQGQEYHFDGAMHCAAKAGNLDVVKFLYANRLNSSDFDEPGPEAALHGHLEIIKWIVDEFKFSNLAARCVWFLKAMDCAISAHDRRIIDYLSEHWPSGCIKRGVDQAIKGGNLDMVQWLYANGFKHYVDPKVQATSHGHLSVLKWLYENVPDEGTTTDVMDSAAGENHLDVVEWLHENREEGCTAEALLVAASNGHLEMIQWLQSNRLECASAKSPNGESPSDGGNDDNYLVGAMDFAAAGGHLGVVQWLHENRTEGCTTLAMDSAASNGHFRIVQWLHENRKEGCTEYAVHQAALHGHRDILEFLVSVYHHIKYDLATAKESATKGKFTIVAWMEQNDSEVAAQIVPEMLRHHSNKFFSAYCDRDSLNLHLHGVHDGEYLDGFIYDDEEYEMFSS